jgi:hypothetical protein
MVLKSNEGGEEVVDLLLRSKTSSMEKKRRKKDASPEPANRGSHIAWTSQIPTRGTEKKPRGEHHRRAGNRRPHLRR